MAFLYDANLDASRWAARKKVMPLLPNLKGFVLSHHIRASLGRNQCLGDETDGVMNRQELTDGASMLILHACFR
jgi:hypothetical protein